MNLKNGRKSVLTISQNKLCWTTYYSTTVFIIFKSIRVGDAVISTNPDTFDTAEKTVLETHVRQVDKLVHLTINGEEIVTTVDHPFYVQNRGFINAGNLLTGDTLISVNGEDLLVSSCYIEECENPETVYNFQVEDYHTYFVGECAVLVHNAECVIEFNNKSGLDEKEFKKQLRDQQDGLGELTIDEYKKNREAYNKRKAETGNGRDPNSAKHQNQTMKKEIASKQKEFMEKNGIFSE